MGGRRGDPVLGGGVGRKEELQLCLIDGHRVVCIRDGGEPWILLGSNKPLRLPHVLGCGL